MKPEWNPRKAAQRRGENDGAKPGATHDLQRLLSRIVETGERSRELLRARLAADAERRARAEEERRRRVSAEIAKRRTLVERERRQTRLRYGSSLQRNVRTGEQR